MESIRKLEEGTRNWRNLPELALSIILLKLSTVEVLSSVQYVCSSWRKVSKERTIWRVVDMDYLRDQENSVLEWMCEEAVKRSGGVVDMSNSRNLKDRALEWICKEAVNRSGGELVEIKVGYFGTDELLHHITESPNQLKKLRLVSCSKISDKGMIDAVSKLSSLEHLEIYFKSFATETIEAIARSCRDLQSLRYDLLASSSHSVGDKEAFVIAENMPQLRHLSLFGHRLTNKGLEAILNGCPHLESLDLRQCWDLNFEGPLGKQLRERCERIKKNWLPYECTAGYTFEDEM